MAELIKLNDGSLISYMDDSEIPEIIKERLSEELSNKVSEIIDWKQEKELLLLDEIEGYEDEVEGYEMELYDFRNLLLDIDEKLKEIREEIGSKKLTKEKISTELLKLSERILLYL